MEIEIEKLLTDLDNKQHDTLLHFTSEKIMELNKTILSELQLPTDVMTSLCNKLNNYKYVDEIHELKYGAYIRWIPIDDPTNIYLTKGAIFCELKIKNKGIYCICKNLGFPIRHFIISMETNLIFQKLTTQELVLLSALDHLSEDK